jgi:hypothetical protein
MRGRFDVPSDAGSNSKLIVWHSRGGCRNSNEHFTRSNDYTAGSRDLTVKRAKSVAIA